MDKLRPFTLSSIQAGTGHSRCTSTSHNSDKRRSAHGCAHDWHAFINILGTQQYKAIASMCSDCNALNFAELHDVVEKPAICSFE